MKILYIGYFSIHDYKWIKRLSKKEELEIHYLVENDDLHKTSGVKSLFLDLPITIVPSIPSFSLSNPFRTISSILFIRDYLRKHRIDLVHVLFAVPHAFWCLFILQPFVITTRGSDVLKTIPDLLTTKGGKRFFNKILFGLLKRVFRKVQNISSTSIDQKRKISELFGRVDAEVIRTGIDIERLVQTDHQQNLPDILAGKQYILSPRFWVPIYNQEFIAKAIGMLPQKVIDTYTFVFIKGEGYSLEYEDMMMEKLNYLKDTKGLSFEIFHYLSQAQFAAVTKFAKLSVMMPHSDGTPNSALEAMALETPLIVGPLDYDPDIFSGTCHKLSNWDAQELSVLIAEVLADSDVQFQRSAFKRVSDTVDLNRQIEKVQGLYNFKLK